VRERLLDAAVERHSPGPQQDRPLAQALDRGRVVRDEDDRPAALPELEDLAEALALERLVPHSEDLVEADDVSPQMHREREAEAHVHARRVGPDRQVDERLELRERDDLLQVLGDVAPSEPVDRRVQEDVLATRQLRLEACAELEQGADRTDHAQTPAARPQDARDEPQERRLPGPVPADQPDRLSRLDAERDVAERPDLDGGGAVSGENGLLERSGAVRLHAEATADALGLDPSGLHFLSVRS
jgi:hypothetical protein